MDKGKRPATSATASEEFDWNALDRKLKERDRLRKKKKAEEEAQQKKDYEQNVFLRKMRRMKTREEKRGKDWVPTKEEYCNFGFYNAEIMDAQFNARAKLDAALKDRKFSEEEYWRRVTKMYAYYDKKEEEMLDAEDAEIARYVEAYEARERQIEMEAQAAKERQIAMEAEAARERQIAKEIEEAEDENYAVDLSEF